MNSAIVAIIAIFVLFFGYRFYGRLIEKRVVKPEEKPTPAHELMDNIDYLPANKVVLFGHHFSSIAGAGPIIGPVIAAINYGWLFCSIWIVLGGIFLGAVHDYLSLMMSVRHNGRSIPDIAGGVVSSRARYLFSVFVWIALVLVLAVFAVLSSKTLVMCPRIVFPSLSLIPIAVLFGWIGYRRRSNIWVCTIVALILIFSSIFIGYHLPISLPFSQEISMHIWFVLLMIYCLIASVLPVWLLLQPRDYLSIYVLFIGMVLGYLGLFLMHPPINSPAIVSFSSNIGPMWPMLCVIIACGAISGFHSLVAGGTTSKQLDKESDGKFIGYGGLISESILAILALLAVTAGLYYVAPSGMEEFSYGRLMQEKGWIVTFGVGYGRFLSFIKIPMLISSLIGMLMLITFILTSLDTSTRLSRFILTETIGDRISIFKNRWFATVISLLPAFYLGFSGHWEDIWPVFGASNQLVAALTLLIVSMWLAEIKKPSRYTLIPCIFMLFMTIGALIVELYQFLFLPGGKHLLGAMALVLLILAIIVVKEALNTLRRMRTVARD